MYSTEKLGRACNLQLRLLSMLVFIEKVFSMFLSFLIVFFGMGKEPYLN